MILNSAKMIYGSALPCKDGLPHLICRPCKQRINKAIQFRNTIANTQKVLRESDALTFLPLSLNRLPKLILLLPVDVVSILMLLMILIIE